MTLKEELLGLAETYEQIKNEANLAVTTLKSKASDLTDRQRIQYLMDNKEFNLKNNLLSVIDLADRYGVNVSNLKRLSKKYKDAESSILSNMGVLTRLGLKNISVGPRALGAMCNNGSIILHINLPRKDVDVKVYPTEEDEWSGPFERYAYQLKKSVEKVLRGENLEED